MSAASESVQILDAISITYTISTTSAGTQLTLMCRYNGSGEETRVVDRTPLQEMTSRA